MKSVYYTIFAALIFVGIDLATKGLAHRHLSHELDQVAIIGPVYAVNPMRNYGSFFMGSETEKADAHHIAHLAFIPIIIMLFLMANGSGSWVNYMMLGAAAGNGLEVLFFSGATDFLTTYTGYDALDRWIFNLADVFLLCGMLMSIIPFFYYLLISVLPLFSLGHGVHVQVKGPNYTEEQTKEIIARYKSGETLEDIAIALGKTPNSVRGKLVSEDIYTRFKDLNQRMRDIEVNHSDPMTLRIGTETQFEAFLEYLNGSGYRRLDRASEPGVYVIKGGAVTIFPFQQEAAVSIEFFGDVVETMKRKNTKEKISELTITPFTVWPA